MDRPPSPNERAQVELVTVYEIARGLSASLDVRHSFHGALKVLSAHLDLARVIVALPDDANQCLAVHSAVGLGAEQARRALWRVGEGVVGQVFTSGLPVAIPDVVRAPEFVDASGLFEGEPGRETAFLGVPLRAEQAVLGVLAAQRDSRGGARLADDQRVLTLVATLLTQALLLHRVVAADRQWLQQQTIALRKDLYRERGGPFSLDRVIGRSAPMQRVFAQVHKAAPSRATVLLRGESGTGKEAIARAVHALSSCRDGPFVAMNCAAIAETLLESELFGHERGAFTGATGDRKGRFEQAHRGSLFLDEIGDISPAFQSKLLRVLQEREFERVGGTRPVKVDVRLICATNRDLEAMVERGEYRADLYYRINVIPIVIPPLRERRDDIPALVEHFLRVYNAEYQREVHMTPEALQILAGCPWPGNVRELQNCIERAATMARDNIIRAPDVACQQNRCLTRTLHDVEPDGPAPAPPAPAPGPSSPAVPSGDQRAVLIGVMEQCGWVQAKAARVLKITPRQLAYALQRHGIEIRKL